MLVAANQLQAPCAAPLAQHPRREQAKPTGSTVEVSTGVADMLCLSHRLIANESSGPRWTVLALSTPPEKIDLKRVRTPPNSRNKSGDGDTRDLMQFKSIVQLVSYIRILSLVPTSRILLFVDGDGIEFIGIGSYAARWCSPKFP